MGTDRSIQTDGLNVQLYREKVDKMSTDNMIEPGGMKGNLLVQLFDSEGNLKEEQKLRNLITDAGDLYIATRGIAGIGGASDATKVSGMKLGTSSTGVGKAALGAASLAATTDYILTSNQAFDATYPQTANLGTTLGVTMVYQVTWAAGTATNPTINSVVIVNDAASNATTTVANTISRAVFASTINKGASDVLKVTWSHKQLGI